MDQFLIRNMSKNILLLITMYPSKLRISTPICHLFVKQWQKMGYDVRVVYFRSMFPAVYSSLARLFPKTAERFIGNQAELDTNYDVVKYEHDGVKVMSPPIYKYIPHRGYPKSSVKKAKMQILEFLKEEGMTPDIIIGHFYNPQMELLSQLKKDFPKAKTCVVLHESSLDTVKLSYAKNYQELFNSIDIVGYRSLPIRLAFEGQLNPKPKAFLAYSGVSEAFLSTAPEREWKSDPMRNFIYVGQFIKRKFPCEVTDALLSVYPEKDYHLTYVGREELLFDEVKQYVASKGAADITTFTGQIPRNAIIEHLDKSDCFIMISKAEVFGLVYLEAMARGCITIAAKNEGMQGIIEDGVNGFLCEAGNVDELASIIERINKMTATEKKQISDAGRKTAEEMSDYNVAKAYIEAVENSRSNGKEQ